VIVSTLIARSLRTIGALASGETPEASEQSDAFSLLLTMLDKWRAERLAIFRTERHAFNTVAGTQEYTIGDGATWDIDGPAPVYVDHAAVIENPAATPPYEDPISVYTDQEWNAITMKALTSTIPSGLHYKRNAPFGTVQIWPVLTGSTPDIVLYLPTPLTSPPLVTTDLATPPGYEEAMIYGLAVRLAPEFGQPLTQDIKDLARESYATIQRSNPNMDTLRYDRAVGNLGGWLNPRTGLVE
jgi:hypothetical protein